MELLLSFFQLLCGALLFVIPLLGSVYERDLRIKFLKRIKPRGWACFVVLLLGIGFGFWEKHLNSKSQSALLDSIDSIDKEIKFDPVKEVKNGSAIHLIIKIKNQSQLRDKYIFDVGQVDKNRLSLYVDTLGSLVYRIIDGIGQPYFLKMSRNFKSFKNGARYSIFIDYGYSQDLSFMRIYLDGEQVGLFTSSSFIDFSKIEPLNFTIAADIEHKNNGRFTLSHLTISKLMTIRQIHASISASIQLRETIEKAQ